MALSPEYHEERHSGNESLQQPPKHGQRRSCNNADNTPENNKKHPIHTIATHDNNTTRTGTYTTTTHTSKRSDDNLSMAVIQLKRLICCMNDNDNSSDLSVNNLSNRMDFSRRLLTDLEREMAYSGNISENDPLPELLEALQRSVNVACQNGSLMISSKNMKRGQEEQDLLEDIFNEDDGSVSTGSSTCSATAENDGEMDDDDDSYDDDDALEMEDDTYSIMDNRNTTQANPYDPNSASPLSEEEEAEAASLALEEEISEMAQQLKSHTLGMNQTLSRQTTDLDQIYDLTAQNVTSVNAAKEKVTDRVNKGWGKSVAKWTLFISVLVIWCVLFLLMRIVPKRQGACLIWCEDSYKKGGQQRGNENYEEWLKQYERNEKQKQDHRGREQASNSKDDMPKRKEGERRHFYSTFKPSSRYSYDNDDHDQSEALTQAAREKRIDVNVARARNRQENVIDAVDVEDDDEMEEDQNCKVDGTCKSENHDTIKNLNAHDAAKNGELNNILLIARINPNKLFEKDENGWLPLHEAARGGYLDVLTIIIQEDEHDMINERTSFGSGASALWFAQNTHGLNHEVCKFLRLNGAESLEHL